MPPPPPLLVLVAGEEGVAAEAEVLGDDLVQAFLASGSGEVFWAEEVVEEGGEEQEERVRFRPCFLIGRECDKSQITSRE